MQRFTFPSIATKEIVLSQSQLTSFLNAYNARDTKGGEDPDSQGVPGIDDEILPIIKNTLRHLYPGAPMPWAYPKILGAISLESVNHQLKLQMNEPEHYWSFDPGFVCACFSKVNQNGRVTDIHYYFTSPDGLGVTLHKNTKIRKTQKPTEQKLLLASGNDDYMWLEGGRLTKLIENGSPEAVVNRLKDAIKKDKADHFISIDVRFGNDCSYSITDDLCALSLCEMVFELPWYERTSGPVSNVQNVETSSSTLKYLVNAADKKSARLVAWPDMTTEIVVDTSRLRALPPVASIIKPQLISNRLMSFKEVTP